MAENPYRPIRGAPDRPAALRPAQDTADHEPGRWVTMPEAVAHFGRSERTLRRWIDRGQLRHKNEGGRALVFIHAVPDSAGPGPDVAPDAVPVTPDSPPVVDQRDIRIAELAARVEGLEREREMLVREVEDWKGQAAALTQTLATAQQRLIEGQATASEVSTGSQAGEAAADSGNRKTETPARRWWQFWKG